MHHQSVTPINSANGRGALPTLVSFYAGDKYYYDAAEQLRSDCQRLGMPHHIEELPAEGLDWGQITREKINFYLRMHKQYGAILWVDVDARLTGIPEALRGNGFDMAGFGGRFSYIRDYNPFHTTRFWVPGILFFGDTPGARKFLTLMAEIEQETSESVTDDYVLHEAWLRHDHEMSVGLLPPSMVARPGEALDNHHTFIHGDSGNVSDFRGRVVQHQRTVDVPEIRSHVLGAEAVDAMKEGNRASAIRLSERALAALPNSSEAAVRVSRYRKIGQDREGSMQVLIDQLQQYPTLAESRYELAVRHMEVRQFAKAAEHLDKLIVSNDQAIAGKAASLMDDLNRDRRAAQLEIRSQDRPRMWWMKTPYPGNFGDILSPWIFEWVTGLPPAFGTRKNSLLGIGSIIKFATPASTVWGSGVSRLGEKLNPEARYLSVRGPITRDEVLRNGGDCPSVYGDPGLLLPNFVDASAEVQHEVGFIRHVSHDFLDIKLDGVKDIRLSGVGESWIREVVREITSCNAILSTSLHGVIVANAYGIPARWVVFDDAATAVTGDGTKFEDYFRSVDLPVQTPLVISRDTTISPTLASDLTTLPSLSFDADALQNSLIDSIAGK